ncbi:MAG: SGNH/GDSL hydrolase family protein [Candidatus Binatia bacterium]|nr:SGNH/GDSL hydrolase family protein [Candidatus Binatia bacterium]
MTFVQTLWFWGKIVLVLLLIDILLFRVGWFWEFKREHLAGAGLGQTEYLHGVTGRLATHNPARPLAVAIGNSVVRMTAAEGTINRALRRSKAGTKFLNLGVDSSHTDDAALMLNVAREAEPWLVIYGLAYRDFMPRTKKSLVRHSLIDSTFDVPTMKPASIDERLSRFVRSHWRLYHHREFVRAILAQEWATLTGSFPAAAWAAEHPRALGAAGAAFPPQFLASASWPAWQRWNQSRSFADYEAYLATRGRLATVYKKRRAKPFDLESSPQLAALEWMLRRTKETGARMILAYFPENPVFRDPEAAAYFNPELSDRLAALLEREAARFGAQFVDLRALLPAEDFVDLQHTNLRGSLKINRTLTRLVDQEARAAASSEAITGSVR